MENIQLLDCTLRDGGRVIECDFGKKKISNILEDLQASGIDIIEVGFIRDKICYKEGTTFFTRLDQIKQYISKPSSDIVVFVDHGMFDISAIPMRTEDNPVVGIRYGFTKGKFDVALPEMIELKRKGYQLYVQDVNTPGYSDTEILDLIKKINTLQPYSFAIVDTYGSMYQEDVKRYYNLFDQNLLPDIRIDFHSHNNYQLSFSHAQEIVKLAKASGRNVIIDSTLYGMGKVAGNLNTELIADFLNRKYRFNYGITRIFDSIDENIIEYSNIYRWGYSTNALLSGIYMSHPNNVIYLTEKFKLDTNDVGNILSMITDEKRETYDYDNIEELYIQYNSSKQGDAETREKLNKIVKGRKILIIAPGSSIKRNDKKLEEFIQKEKPVIISVNFDYGKSEDSFVFFANKKRYKEYKIASSNANIILASNVGKKDGKEMLVDYGSLVERGGKNFDNATIMLLRLLKDMEMSDVSLAGFDGFDSSDNFVSEELELNRGYKDTKRLNSEISVMFSRIQCEYKRRGIALRFLTDSIYDIYSGGKTVEKEY